METTVLAESFCFLSILPRLSMLHGSLQTGVRLCPSFLPFLNHFFYFFAFLGFPFTVIILINCEDVFGNIVELFKTDGT
jgi:hypothetical protein